MSMKKITIADVAREAGVSIGTVSAVINGKRTVKATTRDKVIKVIKKLNFRPEGKAQNLKVRDDSRSICLIIKQFENPFYMDIAAGVKEYADQKGYMLFITSSEGNTEHEVRITQLLSSKDISGAIIAPVVTSSSEIDHLFKLKMINFPFVLLEAVQGIQANVVSIDNVKTMKDAVKHAMDSGHSRIFHFSGPQHSSHTFERIDGFRRAFSESHLVFTEEQIVRTGGRFREGYQKGMEFFANGANREFPLAIFCFNDQVALGLLSALRELDIKVPEQESIIGNDNIQVAEHNALPLTTISPPKFEMGRKAAEILINNIEATQPMTITNIIMNAELIVRRSSK